MKKKSLITWIVIAVVVILVIFIQIKKPSNGVSKETAKCIAEKTILYVQLGCSHCEEQEQLFGDSYQYLNTIDCFYERDLCINNNVRGTPTWIINDEEYLGVQSIEKLKELTGC